ncbi:MAG: M42 family metallopeptidase [Clostridia bacterium]|nr:M42 family metallopeptidase [Clostridia bacterium]
MLETIRRLSALPGVSGRESAVRDFLIEQIRGYADSWETDPLGNLIVFKKGLAPAKKIVMLDAHMDEVGLIVTSIDSDGFLRFATVGGVDPGVLAGRTVCVGDHGTVGAIGVKPIHLLKKDEEGVVPSVDQLYIDIGASDRAEAAALVRPGDVAWFRGDVTAFGDGMLMGKALDDRVGCAILLQMIRSELPYDCRFTFSVQEEIGLRGAQAAAFTVAPDYAIVVETTTAADISGVAGEKRVCVCGDGAVVSFMDRSTLYDRALFDRAFEVAKAQGIPCQTKTMVAGGNNAGAIHKSRGGVKTLAISVPCRYLHSPSCVMQRSDIDAVARLAAAMAAELAGC